MKRLATHTTLLTLFAGLSLLAGGRSPVADEPVDPADETAPALTETAVSPDAEPGQAAAADGVTAPAETAAVTTTDGPVTAAGSGGDAETAPAAAETTAPAPAATVFPVEDERQAAAADVRDETADTAAPGDEPENPPATVTAVSEDSPPPAGEEAGAGPAAADTDAKAPVAPEDAGVAIDTLGDDIPEQAAAGTLAAAVVVADETTARTLTMLNADVLPGSYERLSWAATEMFEDLPVATPVLVVNGKSAGPTLCLTAAVHGDELNGIEMVRRVMHDLSPQKLSGAVIGVPIVNLQGFRRGSRYLPDRRDLNRYFPGNPGGSAASRIAYSFFTQVIEHCDALVDLHTGSFDRANLPQLRADLRNPDVVTLTHGFGATVILHSEPAEGTLRHAATNAGIATVTLEAGGPNELELKEVMHGVKGIETLLNTLGMVDKMRYWGDQQPVYYRSSWVRANRGGILLADVSLGSTVRRGDLLGTITDPMNNASTNLYSPYSGRVIGMARNQVVMPGFAAFHVGIQAVDASSVDRKSRPRADGKEGATLAHDAETTADGDYVDGMSE